MVRTLCFHCGGPGSVPGQGTKSLQVVWHAKNILYHTFYFLKSLSHLACKVNNLNFDDCNIFSVKLLIVQYILIFLWYCGLSFYLFIFGCAGSSLMLRLCFHCSAWAAHCAGFLLQSTGSTRGLNSCGAQASCSTACGIFLGQE